MIEGLCESCSKPVKDKLFRGMCRACYDRNRQDIHLTVSKKNEALFKEYMGRRDDRARCANELIEIGLRTWKYGRRVILVGVPEIE